MSPDLFQIMAHQAFLAGSADDRAFAKAKTCGSVLQLRGMKHPSSSNMNSTTKSVLSKNNLRRLQGWASAVYPGDWQDRCAVVIEYLSQQAEETCNDLIRRGWPDVFAAAERDWPEAFAGWNKEEN
jgi:hypothetical protein